MCAWAAAPVTRKSVTRVGETKEQRINDQTSLSCTRADTRDRQEVEKRRKCSTSCRPSVSCPAKTHQVVKKQNTSKKRVEYNRHEFINRRDRRTDGGTGNRFPQRKCLPDGSSELITDLPLLMLLSHTSLGHWYRQTAGHERVWNRSCCRSPDLLVCKAGHPVIPDSKCQMHDRESRFAFLFAYKPRAMIMR